MENVKIEFLKNTALFSSLSDDELTQISTRIALKEFIKNETILYEEDTNEFMYIIIFGKVKVFQSSEEGKESILAIHGEGDLFGEMSLIDGETVPATVSAIEDSLIALISKRDFYVLLYSQNKILEKILNILCFRLREAWKRIQLLNFKNASHRVKMLFLMLSEEHGKKTVDGITINIKLTHQDIADMTGLTRETVTRIIDRWRKDQTITVLKNRFIHLNPDFLLKDFRDVI
jgi:CRP/FNR family transcriptional regulator